MSIYDRDYYSEEKPPSGMQLALPPLGPLTLKFIIANVIIFLITGIPMSRFPAVADFISRWLCLNNLGAGFWPWQLVTAAFLHAPGDIWHLVRNMFLLYIFSSDVEQIYPGKKFVYFYFAAAAFASLTSLIVNVIVLGYGAPFFGLGASGVCYAVMVLYVMHFPNRMFFFYIPAWLIVGVYVIADLYHPLANAGGLPHVAAHLGGALFGFLAHRYFGTVWSINDRWRVKQERKAAVADAELRSNLDDILDKINREGMTSLTEREKALLKKASEKFKNEL